MNIKFGGLDIALRIDNTCLTVLKLEDGVLDQIGMKIWPHMKFSDINEDLVKIQHKERMKAIGYDRLGVGDGARQLFNKQIPLKDIISSQANKLDMISLVRGLFDQEKLTVHDSDLFRELLEQERKVSNAGNILYQHPSGFHDDRFWSLCYACSVASHSMSGVVRPKIAVKSFGRQVSLETMIDREIEKQLDIV